MKISPVNLYTKFFLMNFYYRIEKFVVNVANKYDQEGKKLLEIGAENSPYRKYFKKVDYFTQDIKQNRNRTTNFIGDMDQGLKQIKSGSFDYILCTQVLEHLKKPDYAFKEFYRILNKQGKVFLTTNFIYQIHMQPNDYWRFTKYGLEYLGRKNGFKILHLKPQGGIFQVISYLITTAPIRIFLKEWGLPYYLYLIIFSPVIALINLSAVFLDHFDRNKELTINYEVIYQKTG